MDIMAKKAEVIVEVQPEVKTVVQPVAKKKKSFGLGANIKKDTRRDSLDSRYPQANTNLSGFLLLEDGVIKYRTEFGQLSLVDARLINSKERMDEIRLKISTKVAIRNGAKIYFTSPDDAEGFKEVMEGYGFKANQFGGVLPSLASK